MGQQQNRCQSLLKQLILDEHKIVTSTYMLNHTPLSAVQVQDVLKSFFEANKPDHQQLNATYCLLGPLKECPQRKCCSIVREEDLEKAKQRLSRIDSCNVFSIQTSHIKDIEVLASLDWSDMNSAANNNNGNEAEDPSLFKGFLKISEAHKIYNKLSKNGCQQVDNNRITCEPKKATDVKVTATEEKREKQNSITVPVPEPEEKTPSPIRKKSRKRIIESDDDDDEKKNYEAKNTSSEPVPVSRRNVKANAQSTAKTDDSDVFCTGDDSDPEIGQAKAQMGEGEENISPAKPSNDKKKRKRSKKEEAKPKIKREEEEDEEKGRGQIQLKLELQKEEKGGKKPTNTWREEKVTENYLDEDGMMVSRVVSKMVENECDGGGGAEDSRGSSTNSSSAKPKEPAPKRPAPRPVNDSGVGGGKQRPKGKPQQKASGSGNGGGKQQTTIFNFFKR